MGNIAGKKEELFNVIASQLTDELSIKFVARHVKNKFIIGLHENKIRES